MPPKRKEDKKHDEDLDMSSLPPWISMNIMIEWDPSLSEIVSLFPNFQFTPITRTELFAYSKEKGYLPSQATEASASFVVLARALSEKLAALDLQGRKSKREMLQKLELQDKPRTESRQASPLGSEAPLQPIDSSKPDKIYLFINFPKNTEEISQIGRNGLNVHFYYYVKPDSVAVQGHQLQYFQEALQRSEKNSPLRTFVGKVVTYDLSKYQGMENEVIRLEEVKSEKETTQEDKMRSSKTLKKTITKDFIKEEQSVQQAPDLRKVFVAEFVKMIVECGQLYVRYLVWKDSIPIKPLFPTGVTFEGLETTSQTTLSNYIDFNRMNCDLPSLDDALKVWDFRVFYYLFGMNNDRLADVNYFIACAIQHLAFSQLYLKNPAPLKQSSCGLIPGNDYLSIISKTSGFLQHSVRDSLHQLYSFLPLPTPQPQRIHFSYKEISYFVNIDKDELEKMILITKFEEMITSHTGKRCTLARSFTEKLSRIAMTSKLQKYLPYAPDMVSAYHVDGSLLLAILFDSANVSLAGWEHTRKIRPFFQDWKETQAYPNEFYDIDELKVGNISSQEANLCTCEGHVLRLIKYNVISKPQRRCFGIYKDCIFGIAEPSECFYYNNGFRICVKGDLVTCSVAGLMIQCTSTEVLQELSKPLMEFRQKLGGEAEVNRVVTGKGTVIRYLKNNEIQMLFANGNISNYAKGQWTVTNNRGHRTCAGRELDPVPCAAVLDPESKMRNIIREDGTVICYFPNKTIVEFNDGTKILTTESEYVVEAYGYAPIKINRDTLKYQVFLSNGYEVNNFSGIRVKSAYDEVAYSDSSVRIAGFVVDLISNTIFTHDCLGNYYEIGLFSEPKQQISHKSDDFLFEPRLFLIDDQGEGIELLSKAQVAEKTSTGQYELLTTTIDDTMYDCYVNPESPSEIDKGHLKGSFLNDYNYSKIFSQMKPKDAEETERSSLWSYRFFAHLPEYTPEKRADFKEKFSQYLSWKKLNYSSKEFGCSEFSKVSFDINRNALKQRQKALKTSQSSKICLSTSIESVIKQYIENPSNIPLINTAAVLNPQYSQVSPRVRKVSRSINLNSSIGSTLNSINYFKSPEGLDFSFTSVVAEKPAVIQPSPISKPSSHGNQHESFEEDPFIQLEPVKGKKVVLKPVVNASVYSHVEKLQALKEVADKQIAEEYHYIKSKDFDIYGSARKSVPTVASLRASPPSSRLNSTYIASDLLIENKIKTVSQTNRGLFRHPNPQSMRKQPAHRMNKSLILTDFFNDPNRRLLEITPNAIDFGSVLLGEVASTNVILKNEDSLLARFNIKQPENKDIKIIYRPGPIAPGMVSKLIIELTGRSPGSFSTEFEVFCRSEIYTIGVSGTIEEDESKVMSKKLKGLVEKVRGNRLPSLNRSIA